MVNLTGPDTEGLSPKLAEIVEEFHAVSERDRLKLLLEYSDGLPPLPAHLEGHPELMEQVEECQSPVFVSVELDGEDRAHLHFSAPQEAPTTRGFAGVLREGLHGMSGKEVLDVPEDFCARLGLMQAISPLRLRGMTGMLGRVKRQVRAAHAAAQVQ
ncbi:cysteine desulfuration protein SufE [Kineococcus xinjiangensis]|uniref:Cysteine desulfuration protein SufE n=1 Tax=Kineococcus xinjiangensis TaxID=512762 RepID=A0A2S6INZ5_9ACTN|nr:SufE family protein [Kineococcus xinjiangensis]PPK95928.1 cysteine desulfuration protein SufE [Kineococcus xinjiangensis]